MPRNRQLTAPERVEIYEAKKSGQKSVEIAKNFKITRRPVDLTFSKLKKTDNPYTERRTGRNRKTTKYQDRMIVRTFKKILKYRSRGQRIIQSEYR